MYDADVIIMGAGPAGLFAAVRAAAGGLGVLVLEKNAKAGRKLLAAGSGKCNLTNAASLDEFFLAYGEHGRFLRPALQHFPPAALAAFFEARGLALVEVNDGKLFPESMRSSDVLDLLLAECERCAVSIRYSHALRSVRREGEGFAVEAGGTELRARFLVLACGGASYPATGSTGDGYAIAEALGHTVVPPRPALSPIYPERYDGAGCAGLALPEAAIRLWRDGRKAGERRGDVLFTHLGLSGPGILDFSRDLRVGDEIGIRLDSGERGQSAQELDAALIAECARAPKKTAKNILAAFCLPESLALLILKRAGVDAATTGANLDRSGRRALAELMYDLRFTIADIGHWGEAMATAGGVELTEVQAKTMGSRLVRGLYFAGEVLDIDGDTGGFNIQAAFSSGALAADSILTQAGGGRGDGKAED